MAFTGIGFAEFFRTNYHDWTYHVNGNPDGYRGDYTSYFISGYKVHGEGNKKFQSNYVSINYGQGGQGVNIEGDEQSAFLQGLWNYGNTNASLKWTNAQQIVRGFLNIGTVAYKTAKLKLRGNGLALQIKIYSEEGAAFYINGWSVFVTGNSAV